MKITDVVFSLVAGRLIGLLLSDFLQGWGITTGLYYNIILWIVLPLFSLLCLWIAYVIGKKLLFVFQGAKFLLVGAVGVIIDLKLFEFLLLLFIPFAFVSKGISFLLATSFKYWGNKYWAFESHQPFDPAQGRQEKLGEEVIQFFYITLVGLIIDVGAFYYFSKVVGPQFAISLPVWTKLSVIFAAIVAALFNFLGYKFLVFKK